MKAIKLIVYALVLCMSFVSIAEAKGRSGSFRSGFSSQKRPAPKPAPATYREQPQNVQQQKTDFGSFGASNQKLDQHAASVPQSQMAKDLTAKSAQNSALKTMDARTGAQEKPTSSTSETGWFRTGNTSANVQKPVDVNAARASQYQRVPQQTNAQSSNGLLHGLIGFMIGNSLAQHAVAGNHNQQVASDNKRIASESTDFANGVATQEVQANPVVESESIVMKLFRVLLWIAMIGGFVGGIRKLLGFSGRNSKSTHYSLRS